MSQPEILNQAFELGFTYTRSTGPVVRLFPDRAEEPQHRRYQGQ
ncbi:MAG: hypothetical protein R3E50_06115 [Halioglobus sp.]